MRQKDCLGIHQWMDISPITHWEGVVLPTYFRQEFKKMIKEITGHHSDALDLYEVTSDQQKKCISEVLATKSCTVSKAVLVLVRWNIIKILTIKSKKV